MLYDQKDYIKHILDEIKFILKYTKEVNQFDFKQNELIQHAVIRSLEIIGEASKKIDSDYKIENNHIEWKEMAGMRDRLIHDYFGIDYDIVWNVIVSKLPELERKLSGLMKLRDKKEC